MKKNLILSLSFLSLGFSAFTVNAEESAAERLLKRYDQADRSTFMGKAKTESGVYAEGAFLGLVSSRAIWNRFSQNIQARKAASPILQVAIKQKELAGLRALKVNVDSGVSSTPGGAKSLEAKITSLEGEISGLKSSQGFSTALSDLEARISTSSDTLSPEDFIKEAEITNKAERAAFLEKTRASKSTIKKILIGGIFVYVLFDGSARYVLAAKNDRDPTLVPLAGLVAWGVTESKDLITENAENVKKFFTTTIPQKFNEAVDGAKGLGDEMSKAAKEEADKVKKSVEREDHTKK